MVQTIQAKDITLAQLTQSFGLKRTDEPDFFVSGKLIYLN